MSTIEKVDAVKAMLPPDADFPEKAIVQFLDMAELEILNWLYGGNIPEDVTATPNKYERIQITAAVVGIGIIGGTGESSHSESGISRTFKYADMVDYIHKNVFQYARTL